MSVQSTTVDHLRMQRIFESLQRQSNDRYKLQALNQTQRMLCKKVASFIAMNTGKLLFLSAKEECELQEITSKLEKVKKPVYSLFSCIIRIFKIIGSLLHLRISSRELQNLLVSKNLENENVFKKYICADVPASRRTVLENLFASDAARHELVSRLQSFTPQEKAQAICDACKVVERFKNNSGMRQDEKVDLFLIILALPAEKRADDAQELLAYLLEESCLGSWDTYTGRILNILKGIHPELQVTVTRYARLLLKNCQYHINVDSIRFLEILAPMGDQVEEIMRAAMPFIQHENYDFYDIKNCLNGIKHFPAEQRHEIMRYITLYMKNRPSLEMREICTAFINLPTDRRLAILRHAPSFVQNMKFTFEIANLLEAIARIPADQLENVISYATPFLRDTTCNYRQSLILQALTEIPEAARPAAVRAAARIENDAVFVLEHYARHYQEFTSYSIVVVRQDVEDNAIPMLHNLAEMFKQSLQSHLSISYAGEVGIDAGGLGRQFVSMLCASLTKKLRWKQIGTSGLYRPQLQAPIFSEEEKRICKELGQLFMFCLNSTRSYPTGVFIDVGALRALQVFPDALLAQDFDKLDLKNPSTFTELLTIYTVMNKDLKEEKNTLEILKKCLHDDFKEIKDKKQYLLYVYPLVEYEESIQALKLPSAPVPDNLEPYFETIQTALKNLIFRDILRPALAPLHELARGMKWAPFHSRVSWKDVREMQTQLLSDKLQGTTSRQTIVEMLQFDNNIDNTKKEWLVNWIRDASEEKIRLFLSALSGSPALGSNVRLRISNSRDNQSCAFYFHTCFNSVDIPFSRIRTKKSFIEILESCLQGNSYNRS